MNDLFKGAMREVITADANDWMKEMFNQGLKCKAIITSLPDADEIGLTQAQWETWVHIVCLNMIEIMDDKGIVIFYQTDRKIQGRQIDKKSLITGYFRAAKFNTIFSKIVLKQEPETTNFFRPTFTNMFGFSKRTKAGKATPDVFRAGKMIYRNSMGFNACEAAIKLIKSKLGDVIIYDPFCGRGSVLKIANELGLRAYGVDNDPEQTKYAIKL